MGTRSFLASQNSIEKNKSGTQFEHFPVEGYKLSIFWFLLRCHSTVRSVIQKGSEDPLAYHLTAPLDHRSLALARASRHIYFIETPEMQYYSYECSGSCITTVYEREISHDKSFRSLGGLACLLVLGQLSGP